MDKFVIRREKRNEEGTSMREHANKKSRNNFKRREFDVCLMYLYFKTIKITTAGMWPTRPRWRMLCEGLLRDRIRSLGSFFPDPASCLGCVCISPAPQALGLDTVAEAGLLAGGSREDGTGLLNFLRIEPLRDSTCFLESSNYA